MILPHNVNITPKGKIIKTGSGTFEDLDCQLVLTGNSDGMLIDYYCEDDYYLDEEQIKFIIKNADKL
jgi:hypothetical protein